MASYNQTRFVNDLLAKHESSPPSFAVQLYPEHWMLNNSRPTCLYNKDIATLLDDIYAQRIPVDLLDIFDMAKVPFYQGCLIVELHDYRPVRSKDPALDKPQVSRVVLQHNDETLWADICLLQQKNGLKFTDRDALELEAKILLATVPPLCLDPDPHLGCIANNVARVTAPPPPASLKRKAAALEQEEEEGEKTRRLKIAQFMDPRNHRSNGPNNTRYENILRAKQSLQQATQRANPPPSQPSQPSTAPPQQHPNGATQHPNGATQHPNGATQQSLQPPPSIPTPRPGSVVNNNQAAHNAHMLAQAQLQAQAQAAHLAAQRPIPITVTAPASIAAGKHSPAPPQHMPQRPPSRAPSQLGHHSPSPMATQQQRAQSPLKPGHPGAIHRVPSADTTRIPTPAQPAAAPSPRPGAPQHPQPVQPGQYHPPFQPQMPKQNFLTQQPPKRPMPGQVPVPQPGQQGKPAGTPSMPAQPLPGQQQQQLTPQQQQQLMQQQQQHMYQTLQAQAQQRFLAMNGTPTQTPSPTGRPPASPMPAHAPAHGAQFALPANYAPQWRPIASGAQQQQQQQQQQPQQRAPPTAQQQQYAAHYAQMLAHNPPGRPAPTPQQYAHWVQLQQLRASGQMTPQMQQALQAQAQAQAQAAKVQPAAGMQGR